eukprot:SAG31_NODE_3971_length_3705_cov_3.354964_5_plen_129_part_00
MQGKETLETPFTQTNHLNKLEIKSKAPVPHDPIVVVAAVIISTYDSGMFDVMASFSSSKVSNSEDTTHGDPGCPSTIQRNSVFAAAAGGGGGGGGGVAGGGGGGGEAGPYAPTQLTNNIVPSYSSNGC